MIKIENRNVGKKIEIARIVRNMCHRKEGLREREDFLDVLRVAATIAVIVLHTITGVMDATNMNEYPFEKTVFLVMLDLITWCVPIFVLISGYLFLRPEKKITYGLMMRKYCRRIVLALLVFGVPYALIELVLTRRSFSLGMFGEALWMVATGRTWSHMWYLYLILFLYLITPILKRLLVKMPKRVTYALLVFLFLGSSFFPYLKKLLAWEWMLVLPDAGIYLFYYICGYLFVIGKCKEDDEKNGKYIEDNKKKWNRDWKMICLLFLFIGMVMSRIVGEYHVQMAYNYPFMVAVSCLLMSVTSKREYFFREKKMEGVRWISRLSFTIYLIHPVFLNVLYKGLHISLLDFPIGISLPVISVMVFFVSIGMAYCLQKIPFLRNYVL